MNTEHDPAEHYVSVKNEFLADKIVRCLCGWESRGHLYHPRAVKAGERHMEDVA